MASHVIPNKSALVTGGGKRIGRGIVEGLARAGFSVAIHANDSIEDARDLARNIVSNGGKAVVVKADLRREDETAAMVREAQAELGGLGIVVNNASRFETDSLMDFNTEGWNDHFDLHVRAPSVIVREFARGLAKDSAGLVVNIIDQRVWAPTPGFYSYTLSKSALWMATRSMAMSLAPRIRVNAIGPGPTLPNDRQSQEDFERQASAVMMGTGPKLEEFARTILYLYETPSITGQMIALDGGQHLAWETPDVTGFAE